MDITRIIREEIENVINNNAESPLNAFTNLTNASCDELPNGEMIVGIE